MIEFAFDDRSGKLLSYWTQERTEDVCVVEVDELYVTPKSFRPEKAHTRGANRVPHILRMTLPKLDLGMVYECFGKTYFESNYILTESGSRMTIVFNDSFSTSQQWLPSASAGYVSSMSTLYDGFHCSDVLGAMLYSIHNAKVKIINPVEAFWRSGVCDIGVMNAVNEGRIPGIYPIKDLAGNGQTLFLTSSTWIVSAFKALNFGLLSDARDVADGRIVTASVVYDFFDRYFSKDAIDKNWFDRMKPTIPQLSHIELLERNDVSYIRSDGEYRAPRYYRWNPSEEIGKKVVLIDREWEVKAVYLPRAHPIDGWDGQYFELEAEIDGKSVYTGVSGVYYDYLTNSGNVIGMAGEVSWKGTRYVDYPQQLFRHSATLINMLKMSVMSKLPNPPKKNVLYELRRGDLDVWIVKYELVGEAPYLKYKQTKSMKLRDWEEQQKTKKFLANLSSQHIKSEKAKAKKQYDVINAVVELASKEKSNQIDLSELLAGLKL